MFGSPKHNVERWQRYFPKPGMGQHALYNHPSKGPTFGHVSNPDLGVGNKANESETSYSFMGNVYETPFNNSIKDTWQYFGTSPGFIPSVIEVFYQGLYFSISSFSVN